MPCTLWKARLHPQIHSSKNTPSIFISNKPRWSFQKLGSHTLTLTHCIHHREERSCTEHLNRGRCLTAITEFTLGYAHSKTFYLGFFGCKHTSYVASHLIYQLASVPMSPAFARSQIKSQLASRMCQDPKSVRWLCSATLTCVSLYAPNLAARLHDRLGWVFFQAVLGAASYPGHCYRMLPLLDFQVKFALKFKERRKQF